MCHSQFVGRFWRVFSAYLGVIDKNRILCALSRAATHKPTYV